MKLWQQIISSFLVLCLSFGGAVGLSPVLHDWLEHGGRGAPHLHQRGARPQPSAHHPHVHPHPRPSTHQPRHDRLSLVHPHRPFVIELPGWHEFWHSLVDACTGGNTDARKSGSSGHEHHSLPQLLAGGLVEFDFVPPRLVGHFILSGFSSILPGSALLPSGWNAQTASRGPPHSRI